MADAAPQLRTAPVAASDLRALAIQVLHFIRKEMRACLFAGRSFAALRLVPTGFTIVSRLDHIKASGHVPG